MSKDDLFRSWDIVERQSNKMGKLAVAPDVFPGLVAIPDVFLDGSSRVRASSSQSSKPTIDSGDSSH